MQMTRQHFKLIAQVVSEIIDVQTRVKVAHIFADRLTATNPNFNRRRFLEACSVLVGAVEVSA